MSKIIIAGNPAEKRAPEGDSKIILKIAEFFSQTIQGEGVTVGVPSAFLRMKDCTLDCVWCDSTEVWRKGNPYTVWEVLDLMDESGLTEDLRNGHHLVLTGGSPLKQQAQLAVLLALFQVRHGFLPYVEVENECMLMPHPQFAQFISQWNNSPKLENSGMKKVLRYKPVVISEMAHLVNSTFKFVISKPEEWDEISKDFLEPGLISRDQVILMPCGASREELNQTRDIAVEIAVREGVMYSDRLHVVIWDLKTGV